MKLSDMNGHKTRARGVYYSLAEEFVATQLDDIHSNTFGGKNVSFTAVVTLIEMRDGPTILFENEPITWELYNTFSPSAKTLAHTATTIHHLLLHLTVFI